MTGGELALIDEVLRSDYLNDGQFTRRFEEAIAGRVGATYAVGVTSGTVAIFLALAALSIGPGDEVVVPDLTFIATANAVRLAGATVVLADVDQRTLTLDPASFEAAITPRTRAVIPVHVSGRGADMEAIIAIARRHAVAVVEDAAEAFLSRRRGRALGTLGELGCLSFSPNKSITTGQGGMVLTNDSRLHDRLRELKDQGRRHQGTGGDDEHPVMGFNFKLTNLQSAVGLAQLEDVDRRVGRQIEIRRTYSAELGGMAGLRLPAFDLDGGEVPLWTDAVVPGRRDALDSFLRSRGAECRRFWHPIHSQGPYRASADRFPGTCAIAPDAVWLPSAFTLSNADVSRVCGLIREFMAAA